MLVNRVFEKIVEKHKKFSKNREKTQKQNETEPCVRKKKKQILSYLLTLVDHQGFDRRLRIACRLPPQLP